MAVAHLIELLRRLGVESQATRSAIVRMTRAGFLTPERRGAVRGYAATPVAEAAFVQGDEAVESAVEHGPLQDGWTIVSFSIPESEREKRYTLRKRLVWLGMGNLGSGLWIAPARALPQVMAWVRRLGFERYVDVFSAHYEGFDDVADLVRRSWDLERLARSYRSFVEVWSPVVEGLRATGTTPSPAEAFSHLHDGPAAVDPISLPGPRPAHRAAARRLAGRRGRPLVPRAPGSPRTGRLRVRGVGRSCP